MESKNKKGRKEFSEELNKGPRMLAKKMEPCYSFNLIIVRLLYLFRFTYLLAIVSGVFLSEKLAE